MLAAALGLLLAIPAGAQLIQQEVGFTVDQWGGVNSYNDSARIGDFDAQDAANVLTDRGFLEPRPGIVKSSSIGSGYIRALGHYGQSESNRFLIVQSTGNVYKYDFGTSVIAIATVNTTNNIDMAGAFQKLYISDGVAPIIEYTGTSSSTLAGSPICRWLEFGLERIWCGAVVAESESRVRVSSFGGASYWVVPDDVSEQDDAPNSFDFQKDDGDGINCLKRTPWGMVVGKDNSLHIIKGLGNTTFRKEVISATVGCMDDRTMQMHEGLLTWLARDGVYQWPGAGPPLIISRDIDNKVKGIRQLSGSGTNGWSVNTFADWQSGSSSLNSGKSSWDDITSPGFIFPSSATAAETSSGDFVAGTLTDLDTTTIPGSILLSSGAVRDTFSDGDYTSGPTTWTVSVNYWSVASNYLRSYSGGGQPISNAIIYNTDIAIASGSWSFIYMPHWGSAYQACMPTLGNCFYFKFIKKANGDFYAVRLDAIGTGGSDKAYLVKNVSGTETVLSDKTLTIANDTPTNFEIVITTAANFYLYVNGVWLSSATDASIAGSDYLEIQAYGTYTDDSYAAWGNFANILAYQYKPVGTYISTAWDMGISSPVFGTLEVTDNSISGKTAIAYYTQVATSAYGVWDGVIAASDSVHVGSSRKQFLRLQGVFTTNLTTQTPSLQDWSIGSISSGIYTSIVKTIPNPIVSWKQLLLTGTIDSALRLDMRASASSFLSDAASPAWVQQTIGSEISLDTGILHMQFRLDSSNVSSASQTINADRFYAQWSEGLSAPMASASLEQRYFLCAAFSSTTLVNDQCWIYQRNHKWVPSQGKNISALDLFDGTLYGGNADDPSVYKMMQKDVYSDDGSAVSSYWVSKDFMFAPNGRDWATGEKVLNQVWVDAGFSTSTIINVGYAPNKSSTYRTGSLNLGTGDYVNRQVPFSEGYGLGKHFRFKFSHDTADQTYQVNGYTIYGEPKPRGD